MNKGGTKVVAVVSGGPDSLCSMVYWTSRGYDAIELFFDYGQKSSERELTSLKYVLSELREISAKRGWGRGPRSAGHVVYEEPLAWYTAR